MFFIRMPRSPAKLFVSTESWSTESFFLIPIASRLKMVVVKKGRERQYLEEQSHLFDEAIIVNDWEDMLDNSIQKKLLAKNGLVIPNRSMVVYLTAEKIENELKLPMYGSRTMLKSEDRTTNEKEYLDQYGLLKKSGIRAPREISKDEYDKMMSEIS